MSYVFWLNRCSRPVVRLVVAAVLAQLVERLIRNQKVSGSIPEDGIVCTPRRRPQLVG
jgi:hypothetical protein